MISGDRSIYLSMLLLHLAVICLVSHKEVVGVVVILLLIFLLLLLVITYILHIMVYIFTYIPIEKLDEVFV